MASSEDPGAAGHVVLIGMMGSGKSSIGADLARRLDRPFIDLDALMEERERRGITEIFDVEGEPYFRTHETELLREALEEATPSVVSTGGGVVLAEANRRTMTPHYTIWLRALPTTLIDRIGDCSDRPLLASDPKEALFRLAAERSVAYEAAADDIVDTDDLGADRVVSRLADLVIGASEAGRA